MQAADQKGKPLPEVNWGAIPKSIKQLCNWGVYDTNGNKRPTSVLTGYSLGWNCPKNWVIFDAAAAFCDEHKDYLPGFFFSRDNLVAGIDLDACRDPDTGEIEPWGMEIIEACGTYTEVSLSGTGVKLLGKSDNWDKNKIVRVLEGVPQHGEHSPQIDLRFAKSFFGLTGRVIRGGFRDFSEVVLPLADKFSALREAERSKKWGTRRKLKRPKLKKSKNRKSGDARALVDEFNRLVPIANVLNEFGWVQLGHDKFQRPGKRGDGHSATTRIGEDGVERIAFWTTEAGPFETSEAEEQATTYSAFDCWLALRYGGDFSEAIQAWKRRLTTLLKEKGGEK